jgi:hypothetical protein
VKNPPEAIKSIISWWRFGIWWRLNWPTAPLEGGNFTIGKQS